jgi:hypothetical protein
MSVKLRITFAVVTLLFAETIHPQVIRFEALDRVSSASISLDRQASWLS